MKIQCDVCNKEEASVFCTADEAALCSACDHRVHHANKLASKHHRFSLLLPEEHHFPICDICQERRAFLFCQQDRAILCRECDGPIHSANDHTLKHNRFLLTGVKLSAASTVYSPPPTHHPKPNPSAIISNPPKSAPIKTGNGSNQSAETRSISQYLIETLPGWRVEDFLDSSSFPFGFSKTSLEDGMSQLVESDFDESSFSSGIWVPQSPAPYGYGSLGGLKEAAKEKEVRRWSDDGFTVPQISPPSIASNKRSRPS